MWDSKVWNGSSAYEKAKSSTSGAFLGSNVSCLYTYTALVGFFIFMKV